MSAKIVRATGSAAGSATVTGVSDALVRLSVYNRQRTETPRDRKAKKNKPRDEKLREKIIKVSGQKNITLMDGDKCAARLELSGNKCWPSLATVRRHIRAILKERATN